MNEEQPIPGAFIVVRDDLGHECIKPAYEHPQGVCASFFSEEANFEWVSLSYFLDGNCLVGDRVEHGLKFFGTTRRVLFKNKLHKNRKPRLRRTKI